VGVYALTEGEHMWKRVRVIGSAVSPERGDLHRGIRCHAETINARGKILKRLTSYLKGGRNRGQG